MKPFKEWCNEHLKMLTIAGFVIVIAIAIPIAELISSGIFYWMYNSEIQSPHYGEKSVYLSNIEHDGHLDVYDGRYFVPSVFQKEKDVIEYPAQHNFDVQYITLPTSDGDSITILVDIRYSIDYNEILKQNDAYGLDVHRDIVNPVLEKVTRAVVKNYNKGEVMRKNSDIIDELTGTIKTIRINGITINGTMVGIVYENI